MDDLLPPAGPSPLADGSTLDLQPVGSYQLSFGIPVRDTFEAPPVRRHNADKRDEVASIVADAATTSKVLSLDPGLPYLVAVHTARPGEHADYSLSCYSDAVVSLIPIETTTQMVLRASWKTANAGGSHIESPNKWTNNPQFSLRVSQLTAVDIMLERPRQKWRYACKMYTLESMMGMYVMSGEGLAPGQRLVECGPNIVHQTNFTPTYETKVSLYLEPGDYIIMPTTFGVGQKGPFSLGINTDMPCECVQLPDVKKEAMAMADQVE